MNKGSGGLGLMVFIENAEGIVKSEIKKKKGFPKNSNGPAHVARNLEYSPSLQFPDPLLQLYCQMPGAEDNGKV